MKLWIIALGALLAAARAEACMMQEPPPPLDHLEGETLAEYDARTAQARAAEVQREAQDWVNRQVTLWNASAAVVLVERTAIRHDVPIRGDSANMLQSVTVTPVRWLKGQGASTPGRIAVTGYGPCGLVPTWDALALPGDAPGQGVGDKFVVYLRARVLIQENVLDALAVARLTEPTVRGAIILP